MATKVTTAMFRGLLALSRHSKAQAASIREVERESTVISVRSQAEH